jgi:hypothetical protein
MSNETIAILRRGYEAFSRGDRRLHSQGYRAG